jgi:hypothetical protein
VTSFSRLNQEYATLAGREDAIQRTTGEVSEQIINRLSLYFSNPSPLAVPEPIPGVKINNPKTDDTKNPNTPNVPSSVYQ